MPKAVAFDRHHERYDAWFEEHRAAYVSELLALRPFVPCVGRGLEIGVGTAAEALPFADQSFDYALVVTTICFVDSPEAMIAEARRVLRPKAMLVIGFIDRESPLGQHYLSHRSESAFYRDAVFYSVKDVDILLRQAGFTARTCGQTLSQPLPDITEIEPLRPGTGKGAFVVVVAEA